MKGEERPKPAAYRRRVFLVAALGYAFIGVFLLLLAALAAAVVVFAVSDESAIVLRLLIPIVGLALVFGGALRVEFSPPEGVRLERDQAPELFRIVDEIGKLIRGPHVHEIRVDGDTNAGVTQIPRAAGLFGSRNYLVIGLPFLIALSVEELRAVVAHELGHLSRAHGRFGAFVYSVRQRWFSLLEGLERRRSLWTGLIRRFFVWYVPFFNAQALPVLRAHEFEADDAAADVAGKELAGASLVKVALIGHWVDETYWPRVFRKAIDEPGPPAKVFGPMADEIATAPQGGDIDAWYQRLLEIETDPFDTHPSIAERLEHLGIEPQDALRRARSSGAPMASSVWLGRAQAEVVAEVDRTWRSRVLADWREAHSEGQRLKRDFERLEASNELSPEDALRRAELTELFRSSQAALARYRELLGTDNEAAGRFATGRLLLEERNDEGLRWLDQAMELDPETVLSGCLIAYQYLDELGRDAEAQPYWSRVEQQSKLLEQAADERSRVSADDQLEPADLSAESVSRIYDTLMRSDEVAEAYLVRKRTALFDLTHPFYVLAVVPTFRTTWKETDSDMEPLEDRLAGDVPLGVDFMVAKVGKKSPLIGRLKEIEGARVYKRS